MFLIFFTIISASLPSKVPVELSVALVLFFFFLLPASGMFTGWLFSISVATQKNPYASKLVKTVRTLPVCYCMHHKFQWLQSYRTCWALSLHWSDPVLLSSPTALPHLAHSQGVTLWQRRRRPHGRGKCESGQVRWWYSRESRRRTIKALLNSERFSP